MNGLQKLMDVADERGCRMSFRFEPKDDGEQWGVKFYVYHDEDIHFYAYNDNLDAACRHVLDELEEFTKW